MNRQQTDQSMPSCMHDLDETTLQQEPLPKDTIMVQVVSGLWIGQLSSVKEAAKLEDASWTVISILHSTKLFHFLNTAMREIQVLKPLYPAHHVVWELADKCQVDFLSKKLEESLQAIDQSMMTASPLDSKRQVLVHCAFGVSRSVAVVAAWLISRRHMSLAESLDTIRLVRPQASPNLGFLASLRALEQCRGDVAAARARLTRSAS